MKTKPCLLVSVKFITSQQPMAFIFDCHETLHSWLNKSENSENIQFYTVTNSTYNYDETSKENC